MARVSKSLKALTGTCLALLPALTAVAWAAPPAISLGLPQSVEVPSVPVKAPTVPVTIPTVPVKAPTVTIKAPKTPIKAPTVPVKAPTVPAKVPPASPKPSRGKAPSVKVDTPTVSGQGPAVPTHAPSTPTLDKVAVPVGGPTTTISGPRTVTYADARTAATNGASSTVPGEQALPAGGQPGYGSAPSTGSPSGQTGARRSAGKHARAASDGSLAETVARLRGCLSDLPERPRRVLTLRTGIGSPQALDRRAAAARLHIAAGRFARVERQALGELRQVARTRACGQIDAITVAVAAFVRHGIHWESGAGSGGVRAARYTFPLPSRHALGPVASSSRSLLGGISPTASKAILILLLFVGAAVAAGVVVVRGSGYLPRLRRWRRRVVTGIRRPR
jgi:hypothetical protein